MKPVLLHAGVLAALWLSCAAPGETMFDVPLMPRADHPEQQGFVRITALDQDVALTVHAWDGAGRYSTTWLDIEARKTAHFNSDDLEDGNPDKGIYNGVGTGSDDWYLRLEAESPFIATSYVRTDGFLTAMGNVLVPQQPVDGPGASYACMYEAAIFNPASNVELVSSLRLVEQDGFQADVSIVGIDDAGVMFGPASVSVPAHGAVALTAQQLEAGDPTLAGHLGDGDGKWRLLILTDDAIVAMNLMQTRAGHITNLGPVLAPLQSDTGLAVADHTKNPDACPRAAGTFIVAKPRGTR